MATTEPAARAAVIAVGVVAAVVVVLVLLGRRSPPQLGADPRVFDTVDALFTAVTAKDEQRLGECEERLRGYREAGTLPAAAADELDHVVRKARSGAWQGAAERLYDFMKGQRREEVGGGHPPEEGSVSKAGKRETSKGSNGSGR